MAAVTTIREPARSEPMGEKPVEKPVIKLQAEGVNFFYGSFQALHGISLEVRERKITALIGPSGCGKSTFLRAVNRISETIRNTRLEGRITLDGADIQGMDVTSLRRRVGMVFQRPNPFPKSIFDNVAYGVRVNGLAKKTSLKEVVERSLLLVVQRDRSFL